MRGKNAKLYSPYLFSGFMKCATCGGAVVTVTGGHGSPRYGCQRSWRNGVSTCDNRLTIRAKIADAHLLAGLQAELLAPATVRYVTDALTTALNQRIDERPRLLKEAQAAREQAIQRLRRLIDAIQHGVSPASLSAAIGEREGEIAQLNATIEDLAEPLHQRLAVIPTWVHQQLENLVGLLADTPERTKAEFQRLAVLVSMAPIHHEQPRPFFRATVQAALPCLAGRHDLSGSTVDRSDPRGGP